MLNGALPDTKKIVTGLIFEADGVNRENNLLLITSLPSSHPIQFTSLPDGVSTIIIPGLPIYFRSQGGQIKYPEFSIFFDFPCFYSVQALNLY